MACVVLFCDFWRHRPEFKTKVGLESGVAPQRETLRGAIRDTKCLNLIFRALKYLLADLLLKKKARRKRQRDSQIPNIPGILQGIPKYLLFFPDVWSLRSNKNFKRKFQKLNHGRIRFKTLRY